MSQLPREARDGLMRAWLKVLTDQHPEVTWVPVSHESVTKRSKAGTAAQRGDLAQSA